MITAIAAIGLLGAKTLIPAKVVALHPEHNVAIQIYGLGTLEAHTISKVGFQVSGVLVALEVDHGDRVQKGQVLARLDSAEQESRVLKAAASVEKAKATIFMAKAHEEKARLSLKDSTKKVQRRQILVQKGYVSVEEADDKQTTADLARAELSLASGDVAASEAALKDAIAQFDLEKVLLSQHTLFAPYDAQVVSRHKELGSVQTANEPLFTLVDPSTIWARAYVDEERAGGLRVGQPAEVRLRSARGKAFSGRVKRIDIESDRASEERSVYVAFDNALEEYHLGEQAEAIITVETLEKAWIAPPTSIQVLDGSTGFIWAVENGRLGLHKVYLGHHLLDGRYEITGGLTPKCWPLAQVPEGAREGDRAAVIEGERL